MTTPHINEWQSAEHAAGYLKKADGIPRVAGEGLLLEELPARINRVLDLSSCQKKKCKNER